jgi:hypothetical protein
MSEIEENKAGERGVSCEEKTKVGGWMDDWSW